MRCASSWALTEVRRNVDDTRRPSSRKKRFAIARLLEWRRRRDERGEERWDRRADACDAEAMCVAELEARIALRNLGPEAIHAEVGAVLIHVVHQDDAGLGELRPPGFEIVPDVLVGVPAIDVQEVDRAVPDAGQRFIEHAANKGRPLGVASVVVLLERVEDVVRISAGMGVTLPGVDGDQFGRQVQLFGRLAEAQVREPVVRAKLDDRPRPDCIDEPERERRMFQPGGLDEVLGHP